MHVYTNNTSISNGLFDFTMRFSRMSPRTVTPPLELVESDVTEVSMSPQHAKAVLKILAQQVAQYEANWGSIPEPSSEVGSKVDH